MSLAPALSVTLGSLRYDTHAAGASICLALLPRGNSAEVALPSNVRFEASTGDKAVVSLDGGEGAQTVLTGKVHSVRREFEFIRVIVTRHRRPCRVSSVSNAGRAGRASRGQQVGVRRFRLDRRR